MTTPARLVPVARDGSAWLDVYPEGGGTPLSVRLDDDRALALTARLLEAVTAARRERVRDRHPDITGD